jgi:zinc D-Ala-D-Ala carboxypeptidase
LPNRPTMGTNALWPVSPGSVTVRAVMRSRRRPASRLLAGLLLAVSAAVALVGVLPAIGDADSIVNVTLGGRRGPPPPYRPPAACAYHDTLAKLTSYDDGLTTLVDTTYMVPRTYAPKDLTPTGVAGGGLIRRMVVPDLRAMALAAARAGAPIEIVSAYRSYSNQVATFNHWVAVSGLQAALLGSARPGHSEHQLGLAIDFTSRGGSDPWYYSDWGKTVAGRWLAANAWRYGFAMSYPKGSSPKKTCYEYEPWHFRYVGLAAAASIHASGWTVRQYLWQLQP